MRRALVALSVAALTALPPAASASHTCVEISGAIDTDSWLGDCEYYDGPEHTCERLRTESLTIVVCLPVV